MDAYAHADRARRLAAEPTTIQYQRAEAAGSRQLARPKKAERLIHPMERHEAKLLRAERDIRLTDASRLM